MRTISLISILRLLIKPFWDEVIVTTDYTIWTPLLTVMWPIRARAHCGIFFSVCDCGFFLIFNALHRCWLWCHNRMVCKLPLSLGQPLHCKKKNRSSNQKTTHSVNEPILKSIAIAVDVVPSEPTLNSIINKWIYFSLTFSRNSYVNALT